MSTVVGPVSIQNLELCFCRETTNRLEIVLNKEQICHFHSQTMLLLVGFKVRFRVVLKEVQNRNGLVRLGELLQLDRLLNIFKA